MKLINKGISCIIKLVIPMKLSQCSRCLFVTKEIHKTCPFCESKTMVIEGEAPIYDASLPQQIKPQLIIPRLEYFCNGCKKPITNYICVECNKQAQLRLLYNGKKAIIGRIESLKEVFTDDEIQDILPQLTHQEKYWIYHHLFLSDRFFYRRDTMKASVSFFVGIVMFFLGLMITTQYIDASDVFVAYFSNAFGNGFLTLFTIIGLWYLLNAGIVEYKKIPTEAAIITSLTFVSYVLLCIIRNFTYQVAFITGFLFIGINGFVYIIYLLLRRQKR